MIRKKLKKINFTGERMMNNPKSEIYQISIARYLFAKKIINKKDVVLDIACGSGIGTSLIANNCKQIVGIDNDEKTISFCQSQNYPSNVSFVCHNATSYIKKFWHHFDVIISFETIEHIKDYRKFLNNLNLYLKPNGVIILSTPNNFRKIHPSSNPYHVYEFDLIELGKILKKEFPQHKIKLFGQYSTNITRGQKEIISEKKKLIKKISTTIYEFDQKYFNIHTHIEHFKFYKFFGSFQKDSPFDTSIYKINQNQKFINPNISLYVISTKE